MVDKRSAPAFSMGAPHSQTKNPTEGMPGPGAYNAPSTLNNSIATNKQPQAKRFHSYSTLAPGPGSYHYQAQDHVPAASILSRAKLHSPTSAEVPGPGQYKPDYRKLVREAGGWTIGHGAKIGDIVGGARNLPGPANYQTNRSTVSKDNAIKIGTEKRSDLIFNTNTPGPGHYEQRNIVQISQKKSPKVIFGKEQRSHSTTSLIPGPGSYAMPDRFKEDTNKNKGFSMSSRHKDVIAYSSQVPGPGAYQTYQINELKHRTSSYSIGKALKMKVDNEKELLNCPGPQRYNVSYGAFDHRGAIFGKDKRSTLPQEALVPGPGTYTARFQGSMPQFSMPKTALGWIKASSVPGPGTYEARGSDAGQYSLIKMATEARKPFYDDKKGVPGPGSYNNNYNSVFQKSIGAKIGNQRRGETRYDYVPGPGNYNIPSVVSNRPSYTK